MNFHIMHRQGMSIRKIFATTGVSRNAVRRALRSSTPPTGKRRRLQGDKLTYHDRIATWLRDPIKSHWTGARILDELRDLGYEGGRTVLMQHLNRVRPKPQRQAEARFYVTPGQQVQIDWGEMGTVAIDGVMTKVYASPFWLGRVHCSSVSRPTCNCLRVGLSSASLCVFRRRAAGSANR
jgi:transposase